MILTIKPLAYDDEARDAVIKDAAWWILHHRAHNAKKSRTLPQTLARIRGDLAQFSGVPDHEAERLAADAAMKADDIEATVPGWDQTALSRHE